MGSLACAGARSLFAFDVPPFKERSTGLRAGAFAATLVCVAVLGALLWPDPSPPAPPEEAAAATSRAGPSSPRPAPPARRDAVVAPPLPGASAAAPAPEADLSHPFRFQLDVHVHGGLGAPVEGASVFVAPPECGFTRWPERTGSRGDVRLSWRGRARVMAVTVAVVVDGVLQPARQVQVEHAAPARAAFGARARRQSDEAVAAAAARSAEELRRDAAQVRRVRDGAEPGRLQRLDELDALCGRAMLLFEDYACAMCHEPSRVAGYRGLASCGSMGDDLHPAASFEDLGAQAARASREHRRARRRRRAAAAGRGGYVVGVVRDRDGEPVADVPLCSLTEDGALERTTRSERDGSYRLGPLGTRGVEVLAAGGPLGFARAFVQVVADQETPWSPSLAPYQTVAGRVLDANGGPLAGWLVELRREEGDWAAVVETARDGRFAMHGVPGTVAAFAWPRRAALGVPLLHGTSAMVGARDVALALHPDAPARARLRARVELPVGAGARGVDVRAVHLDTGAVARLTPLGHEDAYELEPLPAGVYRVQLGAVRAGWVTTAEVAVDGRGLWDLGRFTLPAPGRVKLRCVDGLAPLGEAGFGFYRRTPACDVLSAHRPVDEGFELSPGEHVLVWRDAGVLRAVTFEVESGQTTEVVLAPLR